MEDKLQRLSLILERMFVLYERALLLLESERKALVAMDFEILYTHLREKDEVLSAIRALDKDRLKIQDQFAMLWNRKPEEVTLKVLGEYLISEGDPQAQLGEQLLYLRSRLSTLIEQLKDRVGSNKMFIETSVKTLRGIAEEISSTISGEKEIGAPSEPKVSSYTGKGKYQKPKGRTGSIVEKRY